MLASCKFNGINDNPRTPFASGDLPRCTESFRDTATESSSLVRKLSKPDNIITRVEEPATKKGVKMG